MTVSVIYLRHIVYDRDKCFFIMAFLLIGWRMAEILIQQIFYKNVKFEQCYFFFSLKIENINYC